MSASSKPSVRSFFGLVLLVVAMALPACVIEEKVEFDLTFQPEGFTAGMDCTAAGLSSVTVEMGPAGFPDVVYYRSATSCSPDPIEVLPTPGNYYIRVRGLQTVEENQVVCYEDVRDYEIEVEGTYLIHWSVQGRTGSPLSSSMTGAATSRSTACRPGSARSKPGPSARTGPTRFHFRFLSWR